MKCCPTLTPAGSATGRGSGGRGTRRKGSSGTGEGESRHGELSNPRSHGAVVHEVKLRDKMTLARTIRTIQLHPKVYFVNVPPVYVLVESYPLLSHPMIHSKSVHPVHESCCFIGYTLPGGGGET
jgi:hypothetical protein